MPDADTYDIAEYPAVFQSFLDAKEARNTALAAARAKLDKAQEAWADAVANSPEQAAYETARARLVGFRRWARAQDPPYVLTDPRVEAIPGVAVGSATVNIGQEDN